METTEVYKSCTAVRRELDDALKACHDSNPPRPTSAKYISLLRHIGSCNKTEFYGLIKASFECPSLNRTMSNTLLPSLLKYVARVSMHSQEADYWAVLAPFFDNFMAQAWQKSQAQSVSRASFLRGNSDTLSLFLSIEVATRVETARPTPCSIGCVARRRAAHSIRKLVS